MNNYWCLETVSPVLKAGWEWEQDAGSDFWNIQFKPYIECQLSLTSDFLLKKLVGFETAITIDKWESNAFYSFTLGDEGSICLGFGYGTDEVNLRVTTQYSFVDCHKDLINPDAPAWSGRDAKWYECETSDSGGEIRLYDWELTPEITANAIVGGIDPDD